MRFFSFAHDPPQAAGHFAHFALKAGDGVARREESRMNQGSVGSKTALAVQRKIIPSDLETPVSAFLKLRPHFPDKPAFLFESVERGEQVGRYSILGLDGETLIRWKVAEPGNPLALLSEQLKNFQSRFSYPLAFPIGAFGYISYDAVRAFETLPPPAEPPSYPDAFFIVPRRIVLFDHVRNTMTLLAIGEETQHSEALSELENALQTGKARVPEKTSSSPYPFAASESRQSFIEKVRKAQEYIRAGEIYQVVLSQRITGKTRAKAIDVYRALRMLNPSPYMFFMDFNGVELIGSSPEMLVKVSHRTAETRPIAGTRPRGLTLDEDLRLAEELLGDPKECAEHTMLVDLGRNDLGRVCNYGSVRLTQLKGIERYSHVMHMVSTVEGEISKGKSALDVLQAAFPAGTVTGAPKIRAMEIIHELEGLRRGPYAGCVGYVSCSGDLDTCITIRTIVMQDDRVMVQAGAGIVSDSIPEHEYEETLNKSQGMLDAIGLAESGFQLIPRSENA